MSYPTYINDELKTWLEGPQPVKAGALNGWRCRRESCDGQVIAVHADAGVTPLILACRPEYDGRNHCSGEMVSFGYPSAPMPAQYVVTHEWYRPDDVEYANMAYGTKDHVRRGGLLIRKCSESVGRSSEHGETLPA